MKEINEVIHVRDIEKLKDEPNNFYVRFLNPQEALNIGLGNLFTSRDLFKTYPIAYTTNSEGKTLRGAIVDVDSSKFESDEQYRDEVLNNVTSLLLTTK